MRIAVIGGTMFLGLTATGGGIALLTGTIEPGLDLLDGSPFEDYVIPGLGLAALGVLALVAAAMLLRRPTPAAQLLCAAAGAGIVIYEAVEVMVIGPHVLQALYALLGVVIAVLAGLLLVDRRTEVNARR